MITYQLYSSSARFVAVARVRPGPRPPMVIGYRGRHYVRHTDGNYYECDFAEHVEIEQHLQQDD